MAELEQKCECKSSKCNKNIGTMNPELKSIVDRIAKREGFTTFSLSAKNISSDGNNYFALLTEVDIHDNVNNKHLNLFIKTILPNANEFKLFFLPDAYRVENFVYLELSKLIAKLQEDADVPLAERYKFVKCYRETTLENIVLENMIKKDFTVWNRFDFISFKFAEMAVKLLAKFHSLGFVLEEKEPEFFKKYIRPLKYPPLFNEEHVKFITNMFNNVLDYVEGSARDKLANKCSYLLDRAKEIIHDRDSTLTLCHGDFRPNNLLIKVNEGEITEMVPVDYQIVNYGTPLLDLIYFIFCSTDSGFRRKHLNYLKHLYYDTMMQFLKYFDMDVQKYYPKEEFERLFKERLDFGLFTSIWYLQMNLAEEENVVDLTKSQFSEADFGKSNLAKIIYQQLIEEFVEWGFL